MSLPRFHVPPASWDASRPVLDEAESRHALSVLRLRPGDLISLFNGEGSELHARIRSAGRRELELEPLRELRSPPLPARLVLAQAIPKGKNLDLVIQKATELGAAEIFPLITRRTVARPDPAEAADKQEKWQRIAIEACKQCGQNHLPQVHPPMAMEHFLTRLPAADLSLIAALEPEARPLHRILAARPPGLPRPASALVLIGPEGDFTPEEVTAAKAAGCQSLCLGPIILRTETAAVYTLSILAHELFRQDGVPPAS